MAWSISWRSAQLWRAALFFLAAALLHPSGPCSAANWSAKYLDDDVIDTSGVGFSIERLSGVTYVGASPVLGKHRFMAIQDSNSSPVSSTLVIFDATFSKTGNITAAQAVNQIVVNQSLSFEGIASTGDSVFLSYENGGGPGVREYDLSSGDLLQSVGIPTVFTDNERFGLGFGSLARNDAGTKMWTANESSLSVDGPTASTLDGTVVRILEFDVNGSTVTATSQFAYEVKPIHASGPSSLSGLVELVSLPDGTLLALENSFAGFASPLYRSTINEIDFSSASDVSSFVDGLDDESFTPVGKTELWSGQAGGGGGQNLEGLAVGPRLSSGAWILLGVVDDGDLDSDNTAVSLELTPTVPILFDADDADFDEDGDVDGKDFLQWQRGFDVASLAGHRHGDANHNGDIDGADEMIWEAQFGDGAAPTVVTDFDQDNDTDGNDFLIWQRGVGSGTSLAEGDSDGSMSVDGIDLANWESMFGDVGVPLVATLTVPEPSMLGLLLVGGLTAIAGYRRDWR